MRMIPEELLAENVFFFSFGTSLLFFYENTDNKQPRCFSCLETKYMFSEIYFRNSVS